jgi:uncharacterized protein (DUF2384 family)
MAPKKKTKSPRKTKTKHLVVYVEDSTPSTKIFTSENAAKKFIAEFQAKNPGLNKGSWIDILVTNIGGKIFHYDYAGEYEQF